MDFMFEDEVDEVGSDVEAYCPKCKADTTHVVISKYEDEIRRVQCNPCGDVHSFRKPRGDVEEDVPEPIAAKKRAMMKKPTFDEFFAKHSEKNAKPYEFREHYHENVIVTHPKFGKGFVSEIVSDSKVEVTFKDAKRVLVHNRKNMPGLPLAAEGDGVASNSKIGKKLKKAAKVAAAKKPVARAQPPAAKGSKRVAKPARSVRVASAKRARPAAKRAAKVAKRKK
jgi:Zn ribbon nucleic-acid-binding protein